MPVGPPRPGPPLLASPTKIENLDECYNGYNRVTEPIDLGAALGDTRTTRSSVGVIAGVALCIAICLNTIDAWIGLSGIGWYLARAAVAAVFTVALLWLIWNLISQWRARRHRRNTAGRSLQTEHEDE